MSGTLNLVIFNRTGRDTVPTLYQPADVQYTYAAIAIRTALEILKHPDARRVLTAIAFISDVNDSRGERFHGRRQLAEAAVNNFLVKIENRFPMITIERRLTHLDCIAYHDRGLWEGSLNSFDPRNSMVGLNSVKFDAMINARSSQEFREYQFQFSTAIAHEVGGHLLVTYLGNGGQDTPVELGSLDYGQRRGVGESGRYLERHLFGGNLEYYRDPRSADNVKGVAHIIGEDGLARKIDDTVFRKCMEFDHNASPDFPFPFQTTGRGIDVRTVSSMGQGMPVPDFLSGNRLMMARRPSPATLPNPRGGFNVRIRDIKAARADRRKRLAAY